MSNILSNVPPQEEEKKEVITESLVLPKKQTIVGAIKKKIGAVALMGASMVSATPATEAQETQGIKKETKIEKVQQAGVSTEQAILDRVREITGLAQENYDGSFEVGAEEALESDSLGNIWRREGQTKGAESANYWIDQLGFTEDPAVIQSVMDAYYLNCPDGTPKRWGTDWLNKFIAQELAFRADKIKDKLTSEQKEQLKNLLVDALREETFSIDNTCGIDSGNSCSEDFSSFNVLASIVKNKYPEVVQHVGINKLNALEKKYLHLTFTTENGHFSLSKEETLDGIHTVVDNHSGQSAVYAGVLLIYLNHAMGAYTLAGNQIPNYYKQPWLLNNIKDMFEWLQSVSTSDGNSFLTACANYRSGEKALESCGDIYTTNAIPRVIPAGRLIDNLVRSGVILSDVFKPGSYHYKDFDPSYNAGNMGNKGRKEAFGGEQNGIFTFVFAPPAPTIPRRHLG